MQDRSDASTHHSVLSSRARPARLAGLALKRVLVLARFERELAASCAGDFARIVKIRQLLRVSSCVVPLLLGRRGGEDAMAEPQRGDKRGTEGERSSGGSTTDCREHGNESPLDTLDKREPSHSSRAVASRDLDEMMPSGSSDRNGRSQNKPMTPGLRRVYHVDTQQAFEYWKGDAPQETPLARITIEPSTAGGALQRSRIPVLSPRSRGYVMWSMIVIFIDATYTAFLVPVTAGMNISEFDGWGAVVNAIGGAFYAADLVISFNVGFVVVYKMRRALVMSRGKIARFYVLHHRFWVDLVSVVPWTIQMAVLGGASIGDMGVEGFNILRLVRLIRLGSFVRELYHHITGGYRSTPRFFLARFIGVPTLFVLEVLYMLYLTINFLGMFLHIVAVWEGLQYPEAYRTGQAVCTDRANWVCHAGEETESILFQYWTSVYWAITTVATVGFGDIVPANLAERVVLIIVETLGIAIFAFVFGLFGQELMRSSQGRQRAEERRSKLEQVVRFAQRKSLPPGLRDTALTFYSEVWGREFREKSEARILEDLPKGIRTEVVAYLTTGLLRQIKSFKYLSDGGLEAIAARLHLVTATPGQDICVQGEEASSMFILEEGAVAVVLHDKLESIIHAPAVLSQGAVFGECLSLYKERPRGFRAVELCALWELQMSALRPLLERSDRIHSDLLRGVRESLLHQVSVDPRFKNEVRLLEDKQNTLAHRIRDLQRRSMRPDTGSDDTRHRADVLPVQFGLSHTELAPRGSSEQPQGQLKRVNEESGGEGEAFREVGEGSSHHPSPQGQVGSRERGTEGEGGDGRQSLADIHRGAHERESDAAGSRDDRPTEPEG